MQLLSGKEVAAYVQQQIAGKLATLAERHIQPKLAIIVAGQDKPSLLYASSMQNVARKKGLDAAIYHIEENVTNEHVIEVIQACNADAGVYGILLMMPLPQGLDTLRIINAIDPEKDVDGLTDSNVARLFSGRHALVPCTPQAVMAILAYYHIELDGQHVVVLGRSNVVGKPVAQLCLEQHATVTICHSHTQELAQLTRTADILIVAIGKANFVTKDMVKPGAVVIDVGINRVDGKTVGDVDFTSVAAVAGALTPVPGGVGAVTTTMVLANALRDVANKYKCRRNGVSLSC